MGSIKSKTPVLIYRCPSDFCRHRFAPRARRDFSDTERSRPGANLTSQRRGGLLRNPRIHRAPGHVPRCRPFMVVPSRQYTTRPWDPRPSRPPVVSYPDPPSQSPEVTHSSVCSLNHPTKNTGQIGKQLVFTPKPRLYEQTAILSSD